jgi:pimeloyl-ACP methyl ester carboxylesterase
LLAIIATLPTRPALVGASLGGATALLAAGSDPMAAEALVLVDIVPRLEREGADKIAEFMRQHQNGFDDLDQAADAVAAYNPHRPRPRDPVGLMKNLRRRDDGRLYWHWDPRFINQSRRAEPPQFADAMLAAAGRISVPALLVRGLQSDIVSSGGVAELRRAMPRIEVCDIAGAGHMLVGDRNDAFNSAVVRFLGRALPAPRV